MKHLIAFTLGAVVVTAIIEPKRFGQWVAHYANEFNAGYSGGQAP